MKNSGLKILIILLVSLFYSCAEEEKEQTTVQNPVKDIELNEAICLEFGDQLTESIRQSDPYLFESRFNIIALINEQMQSKNFDQEMQQFIFDFIDVRYNLYEDLNQMVLGGADIDVVRYYKENEKHHLILRLFNSGMEVFYYDFALIGGKTNVEIEDVYIYHLGETYGEMLAQLVDITIKEENNLESMRSANQHLDTCYMYMLNDQADLALYQFSKIDPYIQNTPGILYTKLSIASKLSREAQIEVLKELWQNMDADEPAYWLQKFYIDALNEDYQQAELALINLKDFLGEDVLLQYLNGRILFEQQDLENALIHYNNTLSELPHLAEIHWAKVVCLIELESYIEAVESLLVMEKYFDVTIVNWDKEFIAYPEFLMSDEFDQWLKRVEAIKDAA